MNQALRALTRRFGRDGQLRCGLLRFEPGSGVCFRNGTPLDLSPRDDAQRQEVVALFDRSEAYAEWRSSAQALHSELDALPEADARRRLRAVSEALQSLHHPEPDADVVMWIGDDVGVPAGTRTSNATATGGRGSVAGA